KRIHQSVFSKIHYDNEKYFYISDQNDQEYPNLINHASHLQLADFWFSIIEILKGRKLAVDLNNYRNNYVDIYKYLYYKKLGLNEEVEFVAMILFQEYLKKNRLLLHNWERKGFSPCHICYQLSLQNSKIHRPKHTQ
ncbi:hypothetical protein ACJX0J_036890, partial [Zea mays]